MIAESRAIRAEMQDTLQFMRSVQRGFAPRQAATEPGFVLLRMAEGLITAHRAAKLDQDGYTLDLIEDALSHVGKRLLNEVEDACRA